MNAWRPRWLACAPLVALAIGATACGGGPDPVATIEWSQTRPLSGAVRDGVVHVSAPAMGGVFPLAAMPRPDVSGDGYAIRGAVRYEDVEGRGFLEMWSEFADGGRYYSRTLAADGGPQGWLSGTSGWREFELPFLLEGAPPPARLEIGLVLPGSGTVEIGRLELVPLGTARGTWWSDRAAGLVGGIGGSLIGIVGAVVGWLVSRGKARAFTLGVMRGAVGLGLVLLAVGVAAVVASQPYGVAYPMLLSGGILVAVFGGLLPTARRAYAEQELRRMRALDQV